MAIGQKLTIKIHENDAGDVVFDSASIIEFTHIQGFTGATTVIKNDHVGTPNDAFTVQITTPNGSEFSTALTIAEFTTMATDAVNAALGSGEAGN
jgi:hypothetical protein